MEVDLIEKQLNELTLNDVEVIKKQKFEDAIDELLQLERKYKTAGDAISLSRVLVAIVEVHFEMSKFSELNESILIFATKRHQESAVIALIRKCCEFVELLNDRSTKLKLLETLKKVTDGKLYAEIERAKICRNLATMRKEDGKISEAIKTLEDLKIDTMTSLDREERIEIILQHMELLIRSKEFLKCLIVSKKINTKILDQYEDLKIQFYNFMITIDQHENYLSTSRHFQAILSTEKVQSEKEEIRGFWHWL